MHVKTLSFTSNLEIATKARKHFIYIRVAKMEKKKSRNILWGVGVGINWYNHFGK